MVSYLDVMCTREGSLVMSLRCKLDDMHLFTTHRICLLRWLLTLFTIRFPLLPMLVCATLRKI